MNQRGDNREDLQKMQQEAIRRVQEMQSRAKINVDPKHSPAQHHPVQHTQHQAAASPAIKPNPLPPEKKHEISPMIPPNSHTMHPKPQPSTRIPKELDNLFDLVMKDSERNLLLVLILILLSEEADTSLILSLMYLII